MADVKAEEIKTLPKIDMAISAPVTDGGALPKLDLGGLGEALDARATLDNAEMNPYTAFDGLNTIKLQADNGIDPSESVAKVKTSIQNGTIKDELKSSTQREQAETLGAIDLSKVPKPKAALEFLLGNTSYRNIFTDPQAEKKPLGIIAAMSAGEGELKKSLKAFGKPVRDTAVNDAILEVLAASDDPKIIEKLSNPNVVASYNEKTGKIQLWSEGVSEPYYSPIDAVTDVASGAATLALRAAAKGGVRLGVKALAAEADIPFDKFMRNYFMREVGYSVGTGAFMSAADAADSGALGSLVAGVLGPAGTVALFQASRAGFSRFLIQTKRDKVKYRALQDAFNAHPENKMSKVGLEVMAQVDRGMFDEKTMTLEGKSIIAQSPIATVAKAAIQAGDVGAVQSVKESALAAVSDDKDLSAMAKLAQGTGEASHLTTMNPNTPVESFDPYPVETLGEWADNNLSIVEGHTDLATKLVNAHTIQQAMGNDVYNDYLNAASTEARGIISNWTSLDQGRYRKGGLVDSAVLGFQTGKPKLTFKFFRNPINYFKGMSGALAEMTTSNERFSRALNKKYASYFEDHVYKGLSDQEMVDYDNALYAMTDRNENMMIVPGGMAFRDTPDDVMHLTDKTITAIANARLGYERMYEDANRSAVQTYKNRGFIMLDGSVLGKIRKTSIPNHIEVDSKALRLGSKDIDGLVWSKQMEKDGWVAVDISDQAGNHHGIKIVDPNKIAQQGEAVEQGFSSNFKFLKPEEVGVRTSEIPETSRVLPYRTGYMPIMHSDDYVYSVLKITKGEGVVDAVRIGGGQWKDEIEPAVIALNRDESKPANVIYTAFRRDVDNKAVEELYTDDYVLSLREMHSSELASLRAALLNSGMDASTVEMVMHTASKEHIPKPRTFKHRGKERLRDASSIAEKMSEVTKRIDDAEASGTFTPEEIGKMRAAAGQEAILEATPMRLLPSKAMTARYSSSLSRFVAHSDWNAKLVEEFKLRYKNALMDASDWKSQIATTKDPAHPILGDTAVETAWSVEFAREAQAVQDYLKLIHNVPTTRQLEARIFVQNQVDKHIQKATTRGEESVANWLLHNMGGGITPAISKGVRSVMYHAALGMGSMVQAVVQSFTALNAGKYLFKEPEALVNSIKDSYDLIAAYISEGIKGAPKNEYGSYLKELLKRSGYNTGVNYDAVQESMIDTATRGGQAAHAGRNLLAAGSTPARLGENTGRLVIWMAERNVLAKQVKAGEHAGLKIDSDEFLARVNMKADEAAGNFLKYNQADYQKSEDLYTGAASMATQFLGYPIHQVKYMSPLNPKMSKVEQMGVWTAWASTFGLAGIPLFWDAVLLKESIDENRGEGFRGDTRRAIENYAGIIADEIAVSPLASAKLKKAMSRQITAGGINMLSAGQVNIASRAGLAEQLTRFADGLQYKELFGPGPNFIFTTLKNVGDATHQPSVFDMLKTSTESIPGIYNPLTAMSDEYTDKRGRLVKKDLTIGEKLLLATGIKLGEEVLRTEKERQNYDRSKSVDLVIRNAAKNYAELVNKDPTSGDKYMENFMKRMEDEPLLQKKFIKMAINEMVTYGLSAEDREIIQEALLIRRGIKD